MTHVGPSGEMRRGQRWMPDIEAWVGERMACHVRREAKGKL